MVKILCNGKLVLFPPQREIERERERERETVSGTRATHWIYNRLFSGFFLEVHRVCGYKVHRVCVDKMFASVALLILIQSKCFVPCDLLKVS